MDERQPAGRVTSWRFCLSWCASIVGMIGIGIWIGLVLAQSGKAGLAAIIVVATMLVASLIKLIAVRGA